MLTEYVGQRGVRYLGEYKPTVLYELDDGLIIVPAGWGFFEMPSEIGERRANISYLLSTKNLTDEELIAEYRDFLIFDALVMNSRLPIHFYDANMLNVEPVQLNVHEGVSGDDNDKYGQIEYSNITPYVFNGAIVPNLSYAELFKRYKRLNDSDKLYNEWFAAATPRTSQRLDGFTNSNFWKVMHLNVLIDKLIEDPPLCDAKINCSECNRLLQRHYKMDRQEWLRQRLSERISDRNLIDQYVPIVKAARDIRNKVAHTTYFDRSRKPTLQVGESVSYDQQEVLQLYKSNSVAISTLVASLDFLTRSLILDYMLGVKHYHAPAAGWASSVFLSS